MEKNGHPEPFDFLQTFGALDRRDGSANEPAMCSAELRKLASMNGSYEKLCPQFRADMRRALEVSSDEEVKAAFMRLAEDCVNICSLPSERLVVARRRFHRLSRYWPLEPGKVLPI